jgi:ABC-type phosphate/phosphonate transport system substrate-binding protein
MKTLLLGAVAYDPKVVTIWEGFKRYFQQHGLAFDYVLFSNYERQVDALLEGHVDVAWNSPLAWIRAQRQAAARNLDVTAIAMRDSDCDVRSVIVTRSDSAICAIEDLRGRSVAVGASDSPQATLIPLAFLRQRGLVPDIDFQVVRHEVQVGLHGDHLGGERDAAKALHGGADAACMHEANYLSFIGDGLLLPLETAVLAYTAPYDHCNMTAGPAADPMLLRRFRDELLAMSYADAGVRPLLDLEGLKEWRVARTTGYAALGDAVDALRFFDRPRGWTE